MILLNKNATLLNLKNIATISFKNHALMIINLKVIVILVNVIIKK